MAVAALSRSTGGVRLSAAAGPLGVVAREAGAEAGLGAQQVRDDRRAVSKPRSASREASVSALGAEREADVVADAVLERQLAGQQRDVRRQARGGVAEARVNTVAPAASRSRFGVAVELPP